MKLLAQQIAAAVVVLFTTTCLAEPRLFQAEYVARYDGLPVKAKGIRKLTRLESGNYLLTSSATSMLARITETTEFSLPGDRVIPLKYDYKRSGIGRNKHEFVAFDWTSGQASHEDGSSSVEPGTLDKLSYQQQLRLDAARLDAARLDAARLDAAQLDAVEKLSFVVADGDKLRNYEFRVAGEELLKTPAGELATIRLERIREPGSDRQTTFWLAKDYDYLLVRLSQVEKDKGFELNLTSFQFY